MSQRKETEVWSQGVTTQPALGDMWPGKSRGVCLLGVSSKALSTSCTTQVGEAESQASADVTGFPPDPHRLRGSKKSMKCTRHRIPVLEHTSSLLGYGASSTRTQALKCQDREGKTRPAGGADLPACCGCCLGARCVCVPLHLDQPKATRLC